MSQVIGARPFESTPRKDDQWARNLGGVVGSAEDRFDDSNHGQIVADILSTIGGFHPLIQPVGKQAGK